MHVLAFIQIMNFCNCILLFSWQWRYKSYGSWRTFRFCCLPWDGCLFDSKSCSHWTVVHG